MFQIHKINGALPEGHYLEINGRKWQIKELTINASAKICMRIHDPMRYENQVLTLCALSDLLDLLQIGK